MHVVQNLVFLDHQNQMLSDEISDSVLKVFVCHPDGTVFRHAKLTSKDGQIEVLELVGIVNRIQVDIARANSRHGREHLHTNARRVAFLDALFRIPAVFLDIAKLRQWHRPQLRDRDERQHGGGNGRPVQPADHVRDGRVRFVGTLNPALLHNDFYPSLDVLLITSDWETGPLVAWEAMMHGAAILTTAYRGLRSEGLLRHGDNALVFPIGQPEAAATMLARAHGAGQLARIGEQGRITAHAELTLDLMTTRWIAALQAIQSLPAKPAPADFESHAMSIAQWLHDLVRGALNRPLAGADAHEEWPRYNPGRTDPRDRAAFSARLDLLEADPEMASHA